MNPTGRSRYPSRMAAVYLSAVTAVLSVALALMWLDTLMLLLSYLASTSITTAVVFFLKLRLLTARTREASKNDVQRAENTPRRKKLVFLFFLLIACLFLPMFLAGFLNPYVWFTFMISLTSGLSISEILLYLYMR